MIATVLFLLSLQVLRTMSLREPPPCLGRGSSACEDNTADQTTLIATSQL